LASKILNSSATELQYVLGRKIRAVTGILPILIMVLLVMPAASSDKIASEDADNATNLSAESDSGKAEEVFDFPKDHVLHQPQEVVKNTKLFAEWLYWTGILHDEKTGNPYGIQYTLFQMDLQPGQMAFINHVAVSDVFNSQHPFYGYSISTDQANITSSNDGSRGTYRRYEDNQTNLTYWSDSDSWNIITPGSASVGGGKSQTISMNLTVANDKADYYLQSPTGITKQGTCLSIGPDAIAGRSYYYSHPAMTTEGTITIGQRTINVTGDSWFDHQWGGFRQCYPAWDWFSLRLDNGSYVMLYNLKDPLMHSIPSQRRLTHIDSNGNIAWWQGKNTSKMTATRWWTSPSGIKYPVDWILETPIGKFALEPYFDEQNMDVEGSPIKYWEGIMRVRAGDLRGKQIGTGYLEMTGYAPISNLGSLYAI
jgi:predicted secreted hydrolase